MHEYIICVSTQVSLLLTQNIKLCQLARQMLSDRIRRRDFDCPELGFGGRIETNGQASLFVTFSGVLFDCTIESENAGKGMLRFLLPAPAREDPRLDPSLGAIEASEHFRSTDVDGNTPNLFERPQRAGYG